jgi:hypothetical protein
MTTPTFIKTLVIRDDNQQLTDLTTRLKVAKEIGQKTFNQSDFKIIDIHGRFSYGFIAVYEFGVWRV